MEIKTTYKKYDLGGGTLYQFATRKGFQSMFYAIKTPTGKIIIIDGGNEFLEGSEFLYKVIKDFGGRVHAWFITHPHCDHFGALAHILENPDYNFTIDCIYYNFLNDDLWLRKTENNESGMSYKLLTPFFENIKKRNIKTHILNQGDVFDFGVKITVLNHLNNYQNYHTINDISVVFKVDFPKKSVLFLGDIGKGAQTDLINSAKNLLDCDIVQMAHHGQNAADDTLYNLIKPTVALWDAPLMLWENDNGGGRGSGPWTTLETRKWMEDLGVSENCVTAFGDFIIE